MRARLQTRIGKSVAISALAIALGLQGIAFANPANADCLSVDYMTALAPTEGVFETCGGDDLSYKIPINGTVVFGGNTYSRIFATTNSIITFGEPDYEFSTFPQTPSISLDSSDWVQRAFYSNDGTHIPYFSSTPRTDEYFRITVSGNTFRVDIAARPYAGYISSLSTNNPDGQPRLMSLFFVRNSNGTLSIRSFTSNSEDPDLRNGCVLTQGATPITLEECGIYEALSLELLTSNVPADTLVAISPLKIKQSATQVTCEAATLEYMLAGMTPSETKLESQTFGLRQDGKIIAEVSTVEGSAIFDKKLISSNGTLGCVQKASQGSASITLESDNFEALSPSALAKKNAIAAAKKAYFELLQKLGNDKSEALRESRNADSSVDYREVSSKWKTAVYEAQLALDKAIVDAGLQEVKSQEKDGVRITLKK